MFPRMQQYVSDALPISVKEGYISLQHNALDAYLKIKNNSTIKSIYSALQWVTNTHNARNLIDGAMQLLAHFPEALLSIKKSEKIRTALVQTVYTAAPMLLISYAYYKFVRPFLEVHVVNKDSYELYALDIAITGYLAQEFPRFAVRDTINSASFSDAVAESISQNLPHFNCGCPAHEKRQSDVNTSVNYLTHLVLLEFFFNQRYFGFILNWIISPWFLGQTFLDYRLNMCDTHRYQQVSRNNFFLIGIGASTQFVVWGLSTALGVDSKFVIIPIRSLIMKLGMLTTALREEPLPGNEYAFDSTYYMRFATQKFLQDYTNRIYKNLKKTQAEHGDLFNDALKRQFYVSFKQKLSYIVSTIIGEDFAHLESLVRINEVRLLIKLKEQKLTNHLNIIQSGQDHPYVISAIEKVTKILPTYCLPSGVSKEEIRFFKKVIYLNAVKQVLPVIAGLVNHALKDPLKLKQEEDRRAQKLLTAKQVTDQAEVDSVLRNIIAEVEASQALVRVNQTDLSLAKRRPNLAPLVIETNKNLFFKPVPVHQRPAQSVNLNAHLVEADHYSRPTSTTFKPPIAGPRPSAFKQFMSEVKHAKKDVHSQIKRMLF